MAALHIAALYGHEEIINFILTQDKEMTNFQDSNGRTCLHISAMNGWNQLSLHLLSKYNVDKKIRDNDKIYSIFSQECL